MKIPGRFSARKPLSVIPTAAGPAAGTEFDEFLYAYIGEENNGMLLSVLSALARLNLDPWDEASRLARLPRPAAILFLTALIAALPPDSSARSNPTLHAERLSALLPRRGVSGPAPDPTVVSTPAPQHHGIVRYALTCLLLLALFFGVQWLIEHSR
jgi:hypothetical protein